MVMSSLTTAFENTARVDVLRLSLFLAHIYWFPSVGIGNSAAGNVLEAVFARILSYFFRMNSWNFRI